VKKVLILNDEEDFPLEQLFFDVYKNGESIPFDYKIVTAVADAITELKRGEYKLVLAGEFPPDPEAGMLVDDLLAGSGVFDLLAFCAENLPDVHVCVISVDVNIPPEQEEMYRAYPNVAEVIGRPVMGRKLKRLRKAIEAALANLQGERV
jgi:hypothetical protein